MDNTKDEAVTVSKERYNMLLLMVHDLMTAEEYLNTIGIETRQGKDWDEFRPIEDIVDDIKNL